MFTAFTFSVHITQPHTATATHARMHVCMRTVAFSRYFHVHTKTLSTHMTAELLLLLLLFTLCIVVLFPFCLVCVRVCECLCLCELFSHFLKSFSFSCSSPHLNLETSWQIARRSKVDHIRHRFFHPKCCTLSGSTQVSKKMYDSRSHLRSSVRRMCLLGETIEAHTRTKQRSNADVELHVQMQNNTNAYVELVNELRTRTSHTHIDTKTANSFRLSAAGRGVKDLQNANECIVVSFTKFNFNHHTDVPLFVRSALTPHFYTPKKFLSSSPSSTSSSLSLPSKWHAKRKNMGYLLRHGNRTRFTFCLGARVTRRSQSESV